MKSMFCKISSPINNKGFSLFAALTCLLFYTTTPALSAEDEARGGGGVGSGWRYVKNYFSSSDSSGGGGGGGNPGLPADERVFLLDGGVSFYRESADKALPRFSSLAFSFNQNLREIPNFASWDLRTGVFWTQLNKSKKDILIEVASRLSLPETRSTFPVYVGLGLGLGFYPRYIIQDISPLSFSGQLFSGLRFFNVYHNVGFSSELNLRLHVPLHEGDPYLEAYGLFGLIFCF